MITIMKTGIKRKLEIKTWEIKTDRLKRTDGSLRIVFLADLHDRLWGEGQEQLLEAIDSLKADLKAKKVELKKLDAELAKLEEQKTEADAKAAEEAQKAELQEAIQKLMADGVSAAEILEKLK